MKMRTFLYRLSLPCLSGLGLLAIACPTMAAELTGQIRFTGAASEQLTDSRHAIVSFEPARPVPPQPTAEPAIMRTRGKEFEPLVLAVPRGSTVRFPNEDPILHNVFSVSPGNAFDLGLYSRGEGELRSFTEPGVVRVFCNVHHSMVGYILVLDTPYFTSPDARGNFRLSGLPEGGGRLIVWHPQTRPRQSEVASGSSGPFEVVLEVVRERVPAHLNKFGNSYKRGRRGRYE